MLRQQLVEWNLLFRYDRQYRKKYNIAFNSPQHRETNQIDIYLEFLEEKMITQAHERFLKQEQDLQTYKEKGLLFREYSEEEMQQLSPEEQKEQDDIFDSIDYSKLNKQQTQ
jgi:hypothetical protein